MNELKELVTVLLIFINGGGILRGIYCLIRISANSEEAASYIKKIINMVIFLILANSAIAIMLMVKKYYT